jgi:hypothetical protein
MNNMQKLMGNISKRWKSYRRTTFARDKKNWNRNE